MSNDRGCAYEAMFWDNPRILVLGDGSLWDNYSYSSVSFEEALRLPTKPERLFTRSALAGICCRKEAQPPLERGRDYFSYDDSLSESVRLDAPAEPRETPPEDSPKPEVLISKEANKEAQPPLGQPRPSSHGHPSWKELEGLQGLAEPGEPASETKTVADGPGYLYVFKNDVSYKGRFKFGRTSNPLTRIRHYASNGPRSFRDNWVAVKIWRVHEMRRLEAKGLEMLASKFHLDGSEWFIGDAEEAIPIIDELAKR